MRFENKGVLITGATGGIGRETCFHFAEEGAAVAVTDLETTRTPGGKFGVFKLLRALIKAC